MHLTFYALLYISASCYITTATKDKLQKARKFYAAARQQAAQAQGNLPTVLFENVEQEGPSSSTTATGQPSYVPGQVIPGPSGYVPPQAVPGPSRYTPPQPAPGPSGYVPSQGASGPPGYVPGQSFAGYQMPSYQQTRSGAESPKSALLRIARESGLSLVHESDGSMRIRFDEARPTATSGHRQPSHTITSAMQEGVPTLQPQYPMFQPSMTQIKTEPGVQGSYYQQQSGYGPGMFGSQGYMPSGYGLQPPGAQMPGVQIKTEPIDLGAEGSIKEEDIKSEDESGSYSDDDIKEEIKSEVGDSESETETPISAIDFRAYGIDIHMPIRVYIPNDRATPAPQGYKRLLIPETLRRHAYFGRLKTTVVKLSELIDPYTRKPLIGKLAQLYDEGRLQPVSQAMRSVADVPSVPGARTLEELAFPDSTNAPVIEIEDDEREDSPPTPEVVAEVRGQGSTRGRGGKTQSTKKRPRKRQEGETSAACEMPVKRGRASGSRGGKKSTRGKQSQASLGQSETVLPGPSTSVFQGLNQ